MSRKKPSSYKIDKVQSEIDFTEKHSVRLAYINTIMYWLIRLLIVLTSYGFIKVLCKISYLLQSYNKR